MGRRGPLPKDPEKLLGHRRRTPRAAPAASTAATAAAGQPAPRADWREDTKASWQAYWSSDLALLALDVDSPAIARARASDYGLWEDYYDGRHQPPVALLAASTGYRSEYARWLSGFSDNFCRLVVQAVDERLRVTGFRVDGAAGDRKA